MPAQVHFTVGIMVGIFSGISRVASIKPKGNQFTTKELDAIKVEQKGDTLSDGRSLSGLVQVVRDNQVKIRWTFAFKWQGKKVRFYCGTYPNLSMPDIRGISDEARQLVKLGKDPRLERKVQAIKEGEEQQATLARDEKRKAEALTVNYLFEDWVCCWRSGRDGVRRKDNNKSIIAMFSNHLIPTVGDIKLKDLSANHLIKVYQRLINDEKYKTAIELDKDFGQMIKWAMSQPNMAKLFINGNPCQRIKIKNLLPDDYSNERERVLSETEITTLHEVLKGNPIKESAQMAIWLCLSCTCRIGELAMAEWEHVDFDAKTWFIPAENTKGREKKKTDHTVYLSDFAFDKFIQLKELAGDSKWVFPAKYTDGHVCKSSVSKGIGDRQIKFMERTRKLSNRVENNSLVIGDEVWTVHDLRRTSSTMIQSLIPTVDGKLLADLCLHHKVVSGSGKHYLFHQYEPQMREAWRILGERLELLTTNNQANIVTLKLA